MYEWKTALEHALAQAPNAALVMGQNGIFRSDTNDTMEGSFHQCLYPLLVSLMHFLKYSIGVFLNNVASLDGLPFDLGRDKRPVKSLVVGRPILLALEDIDGGPSFLEKALRFLEKYGKLLFCDPP